MTKKIILLLLVCFASASALLAQDLQFEQFNKADGLPTDYYITAIVQDQQGFLWMGTLYGLSRYDGFQFQTYRHDPRDSTSLSDNVILALHVDRDGMLWVGTANGLNRFDPRTQSAESGSKKAFTRYQHNPDDGSSLSSNSVTAILETKDGGFWVGTYRGLNQLDRQSGVFTSFHHDDTDSQSLATNWVTALHEDHNGTLWIGTRQLDKGGALHRFDPDLGNFIRVLPSPGMELDDSRISAIGEDRGGKLYVGTCQAGFYSYDSDKKHLQPLLFNPGDPNRLYAPQANSDIYCGPVSFIEEDRAGAIWVGTYSGGVNRYDPVTQTLTPFREKRDDPKSLSGNTVLSFYEDRQGTRWIGTNGVGLNKAVLSDERFRLYGRDEIGANGGVRSLSQNTDGHLWIGTTTGQLFYFDPSNGTLERFSNLTPGADGLWDNPVQDVLVDREGMLWVGQEGGLYRIDIVRGTHASFFHDPANPNSLSNNDVNTILEDTDGSLWIGTFGGGINRFDQQTERFSRFQHSSPGQQSSSRVVSSYQDREGVRWFGTSGGGVLRFDEETESFRTYLEGTSVSSFYEDSRGRFWIASVGDGLYLLDRSTEEFRQYSVRDGLPSPDVKNITEDGSGVLWLSSSQGLIRFDTAKETFITYDKANGFDNYVTSSRAALSGTGRWYIGGVKGLTEIDLEAMTQNPHPPATVITGLQIFEDEHSLTVDQSRSIVLSHAENELTFSFIGLHFLNPLRNQYAYRLEGYDEHWREPGHIRTATYTNLSPGPYTFHVKSSNSEGEWDEKGTLLRLVILPPWWRTWWAYLMYGLLIIGGVFVADRTQRRRLIAREQEKAQERELKQAREIEKAYKQLKATQAQLVQQEKMASLGQLTAGIAHEIKNPLNFVNNFAELNEELARELDTELQANKDKTVSELLDLLSDLTGGLKTNARQIAKHGKRADQIVESMMQHTTTGDGELYEVGLNALVDNFVNITYSSLQSQRPGLEVAIERSLDEAVGTLLIAPQEIGRVLQNLLGNAFEAVHEKKSLFNGQYEPQISVSTRKENGEVKICIADNGPGIPRDVKDKVFEPFFTTKPAGSGTGLGLSLSYDIIVKGHGGNLTVESEEGQGASFVISLPINNV